MKIKKRLIVLLVFLAILAVVFIPGTALARADYTNGVFSVLTNLTSSNPDDLYEWFTTPPAQDYDAILTPAAGFALPPAILVEKLSDLESYPSSEDSAAPLAATVIDTFTAGNQYTYDPMTGAVHIGASYVADVIGTMSDRNIRITAAGVPATYDIVVTQGTNGTISPGTTTGIAYGGSQAFTIAPSGGYVIADVLADGASAGAVANYVFSNVTASHTLTASFRKETDTAVSVYVGGRKTLTPSAGGGTWSYDTGYLTLTIDDSDVASVKGVRAGTTVVTYTATNLVDRFTVTILESDLPSTGQDFTMIWLLFSAAVLMVAAAAVLVLHKNKAADK